MADTDGPIVATTAGAVQGRGDGGVLVFKGIPYAEPPFGEHRLRAPVPARPWDGVRRAVAFGPQPPQSIMFEGMPAWNPKRGLDCLTVNVWTPDAGAAGLPVMVWIYGGAFRSGASDYPEYDGARLAAEHGVVVVSLNYRVGMEGFGAVPGVPANRWLLDQIAALTWVRENIAGFGGDPDQVTIFGESAGASSVVALMAAPVARGLFRRVIAQSLPGTLFTPHLADRIGQGIAALAGADWTLESLADRSPAELIAAQDAFTGRELAGHADAWGGLAFAPTAFSPVVDGELLPDVPWRAADPSVELVVGFARDEFRLFTAMSKIQLGDAEVAAAAAVLAPPGVLDGYRGQRPNASAEALFTLLVTDWLFRIPSLRMADAHAAAGGTTYVYELTWEGTLGACHALDVPLTFGTMDSLLAQLLIGTDNPDAEVISTAVRTSWTDFARTGDPGWARYTTEGRAARILDLPLGETTDPEGVSRELWAAHPFGPLTGA